MGSEKNSSSFEERDSFLSTGATRNILKEGPLTTLTNLQLVHGARKGTIETRGKNTRVPLTFKNAPVVAPSGRD